MMTEEDQEDVVFDGAQLIKKQAHSSVRSTGGIYRQPAQIRKHRAARTCCLCAAFLCLGLAAAVTGPTLPYFQEQLHLDMSKIAYICTARSIGYLSGSLAGVLFDRFGSDDLLLGCGLFVNAIGLALAPWATGLILLCCVLALTGAANGFLYAGGNVVCLRLWGARSAPYVQGLYFAIGAGAFAAPLLSVPFLGTAPGYGSVSTFPVTASGTAAAPGLPLALPKRALPGVEIRQEGDWPAQTSTRAANDYAVTMPGSLPGHVNLSVSVPLDIDVSIPILPIMAATSGGDEALSSAAGVVLFTTGEGGTTVTAKASTVPEPTPAPTAALPPLVKPKHLDADHLSGDVGIANGVDLGQRVNKVIEHANELKGQSAVAPFIPVVGKEDSRKTGSNGSDLDQVVADGGAVINKIGNETSSFGSSTLLGSAVMSFNDSVTTAGAAINADVTASLMSNSSTIPDNLTYGTFMPYWLPTVSNLTDSGVSSSSLPVPRAGSLIAGSGTTTAASSFDQLVTERENVDAGGNGSTVVAATLEPPVGMTLRVQVSNENSTGSAITQMAFGIVTATAHAGDVNGSVTVLQLTTQTEMYNVSRTIISSGHVQATDSVFTAQPERSNATLSSSIPSSGSSDAGYVVNSNVPNFSPDDSSDVTVSAHGNTDSGVRGTEVIATPISRLTGDLSFENFTATESTLDAKVTRNPEKLHLVINTSDDHVIGNMTFDGPSTGTTEQSLTPFSTHRTVASSQSTAVDIAMLLSSSPSDTQVNAIGLVTSASRSTNAPLVSPAIDRHGLSAYLDDVQLLYAILSSFLTVVGLCFIYLSGSEPASGTKTPVKGAALGLAGPDAPLLVAAGASVRLMSRILALIFIVCMLYVGVEVTFGQFLSAFAMKQRGLSEQQAALLTALFWGMFAASRGLAVLASRCISAAAILCCALTAACVALLALSFLVGNVDAGHSALWTASGLLGLGLAPVFPTIFVWTQQYLEVSGKVASVFVGGSSLGGMILPVVVGYSVELASAMYMMYMLLGAIALSSLIYFLAWYMATGLAPSSSSRCSIRSHYEAVATDARALDDGRVNFLGQKVSKRNTGHKGVSFQLLNEDSDKDM